MNTKPTLLQKIFVAIMTTSMVLGMCPLSAIADELIGQDTPLTLEDGDVAIVDGQVLPTDAAEGEESGDDATGEESAPADAPEDAATSEDAAASSGYSTMATAGKVNVGAIYVDGGQQDVDWSYNEGTKVLTILTDKALTIGRAYVGAKDKTTISIESEKGATLTLIDPWLDGRNLTDEEIKNAAAFEYYGEEDEYGRQPYRFFSREELAEKYSKAFAPDNHGRAGIDITNKVQGKTTINIQNSAGDATGENYPRIFGGNDRAAIEKNNGEAPVVITCSGRAVVYGGLGDRGTQSGPAAIGTKAGVDCKNLTVIGLSNKDIRYNGHIVAINTQDLCLSSNDFGAAIGAGSKANAINLTVIGPNTDYWADYEDDPYAIYNCIYPESAAGSAIGAGYGATGRSSIRLAGRIQPITYCFYDGKEGAGIGVSYQDTNASADVTVGYAPGETVPENLNVQHTWVTPQTWYGVAIGCGTDGTFEQKNGIVEARAGIMTDSSHENPGNVMGLKAKTVKIAEYMPERDWYEMENYVGYVRADTSYAIECEGFTLYHGTMNVFASMFLSSGFSKGQGIHCKNLTVEDGDIYFNSGILLESGGTLEQKKGNLMSLTAASSTNAKYPNAVNAEGNATFKINDTTCDMLGGIDVGHGGTIEVSGKSYLRGFTGYLVGADNESVFTDVFTAGTIQLNGGKIIGYADDNGDGFRPGSVAQEITTQEVFSTLSQRTPDFDLAPGADGDGNVEVPERAGADEATTSTSSFSAKNSSYGAMSSHNDKVFSSDPTFDPDFDHLSRGEVNAVGDKHKLEDIDEQSSVNWRDYTYVEIGPKAQLELKGEEEQTIMLSNQPYDLSVKTTPENADVTYTSSDPEVLEINESTGQATTHHAGAALITATPAGIYVGNTLTYTVIVGKAGANASIKLEDWTFGEAPSEPDLSSTTNGTDQVTFAFAEDKDGKPGEYGDAGEFDVKVPKNAGKYWVKAIFPATPDHDKGEAECPFEIKKAASKVTPESTPLVAITSDDGGTSMRVDVYGDGDLKVESADKQVATVGAVTKKTDVASGANVTVWDVKVNGRQAGSSTQLKFSVEGTDNFEPITSESPKTVELQVKNERTKLYAKPAVRKMDGRPEPLPYNGKDQELFTNYKSDGIAYTGTVLAKEPGNNYTATFTPKSGYAWPDGSTDSITLTGEIVAKPINTCTVSAIPEQTFMNKELTPEPEVSFGTNTSKITLKKGEDYELKYENNKNAGNSSATVIIEAKAPHYSGSTSATFTIKPIDIWKNPGLIAPYRPYELTYNGEAQTAPFMAWWKADEKDKSSKDVYLETSDYEVSYTTPDSKEARASVKEDGTLDSNGKDGKDGKTYQMHVVGKGNYTGEYDYTYKIIPAKLEDLVVTNLKTKAYTGSEVEQDIKLTNKEGKVIPKEDYKVSYSHNDRPGTATLTITPNTKTGNLIGSKTVEFKITSNSSTLKTVAIPQGKKFVYNGATQVGVPKDEGYTAEGVTESIDTGNFVAWVTPNEGYAWDASGDVSTHRVDWSIEKINLAEAKIENVTDAAYVGMPIRQNPKVSYNGYVVDSNELLLTYENNETPGTATVIISPKGHWGGKDNLFNDAKYNPYLTGSVRKEFQITQAESTVNTKVYADAQIKDGRKMESSVGLYFEGNDLPVVTSEDTSIATVSVKPAKASSSGKKSASVVLATDSKQEMNSSEPNYDIVITPQQRGATVIHVQAPAGSNYKVQEALVYVTVDEFHLGRRLIDAPVGLTLSYTGSPQVGIAYDDEGIDFVGSDVHVATEPNTYTAWVQPKAGFIWANNQGNEARSIQWKIVGSKGSISANAKDTTVNLSEGATPITYRATYVGMTDVVVENSSNGVATVATVKPEGTTNTIDITITPQNVGSTLITVKPNDEQASGVMPLSFYFNVVKDAGAKNIVTPPEAVTGLTFNGQLQVGVRKGDGYTLSGPSVPTTGDNASNSVGLNAGDYWVKATLTDETAAWDELGDREPKLIKWTIGKVNLNAAEVSGVEDKPATGDPVYQEDLELSVNGVVVSPAEYTVSYSPQHTTTGTVTVTISATERNYTGTKTATFKITDPNAAAAASEGAQPMSAADNPVLTGLAEAFGVEFPSGFTAMDADTPEPRTNDPKSVEQYHLYDYVSNVASTTSGPTNNKSGASVFSMWDLAKGEELGSVTVAVIDTGCVMNHEDLVNVIDQEHTRDIFHRDYPAGALYMMDGQGHGTHVCGIVGAQVDNGLGVAGASKATDDGKVKILPIKVFDDLGRMAESTDLIAAFDYLDKLIEDGDVPDLKVINMSLGGYGKSEDDDILQEKITHLYTQHDVLTVAAGGNGDDYGNPITAPSYPSDYDNVLSVTSLNSTGGDSTWSDYNMKKDISAPGEGILSTYKGGYRDAYAEDTGTSMASPLVAGIAAFLYEAYPSASATDIETAIKKGAHKIPFQGDRARNTGSAGAVDGQASLKWLQTQYEGVEHYLSQCTITVPAELMYTGSALTPAVTVVNEDGETAGPETDYTVTYSKNTQVGTAQVTVVGKGSYRGTARLSFDIRYDLVSRGGITAIANQQLKNGVAKPLPTVTYDGRVLTAGQDYSLSYANNTESGRATVSVTGVGDYAGTISRTFEIVGEGAADKTVQPPTNVEIPYNGQEQVGIPEVEGVYTVTGDASGKDAKTYTAKLQLNAGYTWSDNESATRDVTWEITPIEPTLAPQASIVALPSSSNETTVEVVYGGDGELTASADSSGAVNASISPSATNGVYTLTITKGTGETADKATVAVSADAGTNYTAAKATVEVQITKDSEKQTVSASYPSDTTIDFAGVAQPGLLAGDGYTIKLGTGDQTESAYIDATTGNAMVTAAATYHFTIEPTYSADVFDGGAYTPSSAAPRDVTVTVKPVDAARLTVAPIENATYNHGDPVTPDTSVQFKSGMTLANGTDYTIKYGNNTNVTNGEAKATAKLNFTGNYTGSRTLNFKIGKAPSSLALSAEHLQFNFWEEEGKQAQTVNVTHDESITPTIKTTKNDGVAEVMISGDGNQITVTPKKAGEAIVEVDAAGNDNYEAGTKTLNINVAEQQIAAPMSTATSYIYDGSPKTLVPKGDHYTLSFGDESIEGAKITAQGAVATNAGTYHIIATPEQGYGWDSAPAGPRTYDITIEKASSTLDVKETEHTFKRWETQNKAVTIPFTYSGSVDLLAPQTDHNDVVSAAFANGPGGTPTGVTITPQSVGSAKVQITDPGDSNHAQKTETIRVEVKDGVATPPTAKDGLKYKETSIEGLVAGEGYKLSSTDAVTLNGLNATAVNVGTYTVTATLDTDGFYTSWEGGGKEPIDVSFTINKGDNPLSAETITSLTEGESKTIKLSNVTGAITVTNTTQSLVDCELSGNDPVAEGGAYPSTASLKITAKAPGSASLTVNVAGNNNYEPGSIEIPITVSKKSSPTPPAGGGGALPSGPSGGSTGGGTGGGTGGSGGGAGGGTGTETEETEAKQVQEEVVAPSTVEDVNKASGTVAEVTAEPVASGSSETASSDVTWTVAIADEEAPVKEVSDGPVKGIVTALVKNTKAETAQLVGNAQISITLSSASARQIEEFCQKCVDWALAHGVRTQATTTKDAGDLANTSFQLTITCADGSTATHTVRFTAPGSTTPVQEIPVYRLYNHWSGEHLFTTNKQEYDDLPIHGWLQEDIAWYSPTDPSAGKPVYRLYNHWSGDHYYTMDYDDEAQKLLKAGWQWDEDGKPLFYTVTPTNAATKAYPIYQLYNPYEKVGTHMWTTEYKEYKDNTDLGWIGENVKFYASSLPSAKK